MDRPSKSSNYKYTQLFGYKGPNEKIVEEDIISKLRFDPSGNYLAVGDKAGRVIVFETKEQKKGAPLYEYFSEFQSHFKEFDPLRSMEVEE
jgi:serine/threonine-protein phosphatase 2A regulatory subunit B